MSAHIGARGARLLGRERDCALLDDLVSAIRRGEGRSLILRGEAGIGKTALLEHLVESASDLTLVRAVGVESEMELAYAGLHQVCGPLLDRLARLPPPQRRALEIVFGLSDGAPPDRALVGLAVLGLLSEVADDRPLLCVVDDAQWLDHASAVTLVLVARRLSADPIGIVFAAREPGQELQHLPELRINGLVDADARALLASVVGRKLDAQVRDRIITETHGNPLALLELPRDLTATELAGGFGFSPAEGVPDRIEESFVRRIEALSNDARRLLLLAALEPLGDPLLFERAAEQLGIGALAVVEETDGLLALGARVTFRHPLVRSAVYRTAPVKERLAAHLALARATDPVADPDRRAWHLASAAAGPDEQVAVELERSAARARARGGLAAAAAFLQRAVALTEDPTRRPERVLAAAEESLQAGAFEPAVSLLATAQNGPLDGFQRARSDLLRGHIAFASGHTNGAASMLLKAANRLEKFDLTLARETYLAAWGATVVNGEMDLAAEIWRDVRALPPPPTPSPLDLLLDGLALLATEGHVAATGALRQAAEVLTTIPVDDVLRWGWTATGASTAIWDDERFYSISARQVQLVRDAGALAQLPLYLSQLGIARAWRGDFDGAASLIAESDSVAAATGTSFPPYARLMVCGMQGREAEASAAISSAMEQAAAGAPSTATHADRAAAVLFNGLGRYQDAASAAGRAVSDAFDPWCSMWALPELVEAATRSGNPETAREALDRLAATTRPSSTDFALGIEARSRALLSDGVAADELYREALDRLSRTELRTELARAQLLYGEWLRREQRRVDAREQLRAAHDHLTSLGMEAFAERARMELLATGERVRKRTAETRDELTAQQRQIARLARDGLSNGEIGARLFLSPRTVEWHLRKVFTKLGVRSRLELAGSMASPDSELVAR